jgi:outer membrane protein
MSKLLRPATRQVCRPALACLLAGLSLAAGPLPLTAQPPSPSEPANPAAGSPPSGTAAAPANPPATPAAPPGITPPPDTGAPASGQPGAPASSQPGAPASGQPANPAPTPGTAAPPNGPGGTAPPAATSTVPAGAVGGLAPSDRIAVDVWELNPDAKELHLDVRDNVLNLTLDQGVEIALRRNLGLILQRYIRNEARLAVDQALGIYDLNVTGQVFDQRQSSPAITAGTSASTTVDDLRVGLNQLFPTGGTFTATWDNAHTRQPVTAFNLIGQFYQPTTTFALTQPLLRNFGSNVTDQGILLAYNTSEANRVLFELQIIGVSQQVVNAYWNLVNAREQLVVAQESLQLARDLNERNRIQVQVGTLAPLEIVQSEAAIATREQGIITAQQAIGDAADALRLALNLPEGDLWQLEILPTTPPESPTIQIDLNESIATAFQSRAEVRTENLNVERAKIVDRAAKSALLPTLNFVANYNLTGVGTSFSSALSQVGNLDFPGWTIGFTFAYPIQNRASRAAKAIADLDVDRFKWELDQEKRTVLQEVRKAVRGLETAEKVIVAAHASRNFQERNLDAERKRYENGMSTSFQITQIQDQLTLAKQSEVNAVTSYRTALAEYYRSIGKLLPELGVKILDPKQTIDRFSFRRANLIP